MANKYTNVRGQKQSGMIGQTFERLKVICYDVEMSILRRADYYLCYCDCGKKKVVKGLHLRGGATRSCGCLSQEVLHKMNSNRMGENNPTYYHGLTVEAADFRKDIRHRDKVCQRCGKTKEKNGRELSVHHLDGNHYNNVLDNGIAYCTSCHIVIEREIVKSRKEMTYANI